MERCLSAIFSADGCGLIGCDITGARELYMRTYTEIVGLGFIGDFDRERRFLSARV